MIRKTAMRIGYGYDIHRLVKGRKLIIGGIEIPFEKGLLGHTDADVLLHAIIDALLGAAGLGDIGGSFPDSDPKWKDADSLDLLETSHASVINKGYKISNIDCTVVAEEPKLSPYISKIKKELASALNINESMINIKAKTNEGLDAIGNKEAILAHAVVLLE